MRRLLLLLMLLAPGLASAHAILMRSDPEAGGTVAPGAQEIVLRFNSRIDQARSRLTLKGTHADTSLPLLPNQPQDSLAARAELTPGDYTLHWQVLAIDGHITRGDVRFSVRPR